MKTSKFLVSVLLSGIVLMSSAFATEVGRPGNAPTSVNNAVRDQIVKALSDVSAIDKEVTIKFALTEKKGFELLKVEGENANLIALVKAELVNERILVPENMEGVYSLKVKFSDIEVEKAVDASTTMRYMIANALSDVTVMEPASVKINFNVTNDSFTLKNVEGDNKTLVSKVETVLENSTIVPPAELAGNYQVTVKF